MTSQSQEMPVAPQASVDPAPGLTLVVGLGASAGGLVPLQQLLASLPATSGFACVVVQHLAPEHPSLLVELLARRTLLTVHAASDGARLEPDHVYVITPGTRLTVRGGALQVTALDHPTGTIDALLRSLAEDQGERAAGVLLSGAGHDGTEGLRAIRDRRGLTLAQAPDTASHDDMVRSAIDAGLVDHVLPVTQMVGVLQDHAARLAGGTRSSVDAALDAQLAERLGEICTLVHQRTGHDFSRYKVGTLLRRTRRRLQLRHVASVQDYLRMLEAEPAEAAGLLEELLIGVTRFFRDPEAFEALEKQVVPHIVQGKSADAPIRIWVAGCASGEEAYSIAIVVREHLERLESPRLVQIFATDLDGAQLADARLGRYPLEIAEHVSSERLARSFVRDGQEFQVVKELRDMCIFSEHSLIRDPPFSQVDLVSCRNVFIYLGAELQRQLVPLFHYALRPGGFLFLGPSEGLTGSPGLFEPVDQPHRIFRRRELVSRPSVDFPLASPRAARAAFSSPGEPPVRPAPSAHDKVGAAFARVVLEEYAPPSAIINAQGDVLFVAGPIGHHLQLPAGAWSGANLLESFRGGLRHALRTALRVASAERRKVVRKEVEVEDGDASRRVRLVVRPLAAAGAEEGLYLVVLQDVGPATGRDDDTVEDAGPPAVELLEAELRTARAELRDTVEDLESANEELKSSNEELIATNEELQSANEELQSSKEEMQSLNEELEAVNAELREKLQELGAANSDLQNLFGATRIATIFVDRALRITRYTPAAGALFHLRDEDVGRPLGELPPRFSELQLVADAQRVLSRLEPEEHQLRSTEGDWYVLRLAPYRTVENRVAGVVVTFVDVTELKRAEEALRRTSERERLLADVLENAGTAFGVGGADGSLLFFNRAFAELTGYSREELDARRLTWAADLTPPEWREREQELLATAVRTGEMVRYEKEYLRKDGTRVPIELLVQPARDADGRLIHYRAFITDITGRKEAAARLAWLASFPETVPLSVIEIDRAGQVTYANPAARKLFPELPGRAPRWLAEWVAQAPQATPGAGEVRLVRAGEATYQQTLFFSEESGRLRVYGMDVSERLRDQAALDLVAQQRQLALDAANMGWWQYDPRSRVSTYDDRYREIFGVTGHERPNDEILKMLHPDDLPHVWAAVEAALSPVNPVRYAAEYRINRPDGETRWIEAHGLATFEGEGHARHATSLVGTVVDVTARKHAELEKHALLASVREEKDRLAAVVSSANDEIWFCDSRGRITLANPSAVREFRLSPAEAGGVAAFASALDVLRGDGTPRPTQEAPLLRALRGEVLKDEVEIIRTPASGELRQREVSASPVKDAAGRIVGAVGLVRDITERKRSEAALLAGHRRIEAILEGMADAFFSLDDAWRFVTVNPAAERAPFSRPASELLGRVIWEVFPAFDGTQARRRYAEVVRTGVREHYEIRSPLDGRWREVFLFPREGGLDVYLRDIDDRKRAEQALRDSEAKYRNLFQNMTEEVHFWRLVRDEGGRIVTWRLVAANPPALKTWNKSLAEVEGRTTDEIFGPGSTEHYRPLVEKVLAEGAPHSYEDFFPNLGKYFRFTTIPLGDHFITTGADITEIKKAVAEVEAANARLTEDDRRKNEFLAMLSHELRNPLTPIRNSLYVLEHAEPGSERARRAQQVIDRQSNQLARLVDDLLDITRISRSKIQLRPAPLELNELVRRTLEDHRSMFEGKGVALDARLGADPLPIDGDAARLAQAIGNLLQNASKFTPAGGRVTVETGRDGGRATLRIADTGEGIAPALLPRLFEPFMQAETSLDRSRGGLGLGLALVKGLVQMHEGEVRAHSEGLGRGAQFVVELPLDRRAHGEPATAPQDASHPTRRRRVLIIEDNVDAADTLREVLELGDHVVEIAHDGPAGLERARVFKPDVVLCDIGLPRMDGFAVARAFRADPALAGITLVALSGYATPDDLQRAAEAGFHRHVAKPPTIEAIERLVEELPGATPAAAVAPTR